MESKYVERFMANKSQLERSFSLKQPDRYKELVTEVIGCISSGDYGDLDKSKITEIDYGDYQGTLLYIITTKEYQPSDFWAVKVSYGSCGGCDTLRAIKDDYSKKDQIEQYMTLALHIVQNLKKI